MKSMNALFVTLLLLLLPAFALAEGYCNCNIERFESDPSSDEVIIYPEGDGFWCNILWGWCEPGCFSDFPPEVFEERSEREGDAEDDLDGTVVTRSIQIPCFLLGRSGHSELQTR